MATSKYPKKTAGPQKLAAAGDRRSTDPDPRRVFVVYGRNIDAYKALVLCLRTLRLDPLSFDEVRNEIGGSPYVGEIVQEGMRRAQAVVVLFTPDEYASLHLAHRDGDTPNSDVSRWQSRPNVLIEAGMALTRDRNRTILALLGDARLPSDLSGLHLIRLNNSPKSRDELKNALIGSHCDVYERTSGLYDVGISGDFEKCLPIQTPHPLDPFLNTYDELADLTAELAGKRIGGRTLLELTRLTAQEWPGGDSTSILWKAAEDAGVANAIIQSSIYWWIVFGVLRFVGVDDNWETGSLDITVVTRRGQILLDRLKE
jgi:predicted nucleotide-binding protein